jgi:hypothetical protein
MKSQVGVCRTYGISSDAQTNSPTEKISSRAKIPCNLPNQRLNYGCMLRLDFIPQKSQPLFSPRLGWPNPILLTTCGLPFKCQTSFFSKPDL